MPANYVLLERIELNDLAASVTFANIPQTGYTDLKVVMSTRAADSANNWYLTKIQFNTDTTSGNYSARFVGGFGSTQYSSTSSNYAGYITSGARTASTFGNNEIYIPNYLGNEAKSFSTDSVTEGNASAYEILGLWAGLWSGTAAINQIVLSPDTGSFARYSTFSLYGLAAVGTTPVIAPKAAGGNIIATDGTYWYHTFLASGNFVPATSLTCDALVIAGGGGGGAYSGGGGGAGGLLAFTSQSISSSTVVTVGSGGASGGNSGGGTGYGSNGTDSQLGALTLVLAGGGGGSSKSGGSRAGQSGGSGGGATSSATTGGAGTSGQGFAGGNYASSGGGGGGGSAEAGNTDGVYLGGDGLSTYSSWGLATTTGQNISGTVYYAGGGGGDSNSTGAGGGDGGGGGSSTNGTTNTGGGGGAWNGSGSAGNGGSGIVIIRYAMV